MTAGPAENLRAALELRRHGLNVLPLRSGTKRPALAWEEYQQRWPDLETEIVPQFARADIGGYFVVAGSVSRLVVIDCDSDVAVEHWRQQLGDVLDRTTCARTPSGGLHFWFRLPQDVALASWAVHRDGLDFDIQAEGKGVVAPPGPGRSWERGPEQLLDAPALLLAGRPTAAERPDSTPAVRVADVFDGVPAGGRDAAAFAYACSLRARSIREPEALVLMTEAWRRMEQPPDDHYPLADATEKVRRVYREKPAGPSGGQANPTLRDALLDPQQLKDLPPPQWLIQDVLVRDTLAVVYGLPATGKSLLTLDWAFSIGSGEHWQGKPTVHGPVLYLAAEGRAGLGLRVGGWEAGHGGVLADGVSFLPRSVNLLDAAAVSELEALTAELRPVLVVIDTLARCLVGAEENSAKDLGVAVDAADRLRRASGATVLLVHHTRKDGLEVRGSSALLGAVDTAALVLRNGSGLTVKCTKQKDAAEFDDLRLRISPAGPGATIASHDVHATLLELRRHDEAALEVIVASPFVTGGTRAQLRDVVMKGRGVRRDTAYRAVRDLESTGLLRREGSLLVIGERSRRTSHAVASASHAMGARPSHRTPTPRECDGCDGCDIHDRPEPEQLGLDGLTEQERHTP